MKRRKFLQSTSLASIPLWLGGTPLTAVGKNKLFDLIGSDNDKVLVLIQLQGGNDGLSAVVPIDQYSNLMQVRSNVLVPESSLHTITDTIGFHPAMRGLKNVWEESRLGLIQGVAYPNQNRSHFRSTDIWNTASEPDEFLTTGWMGRYFDLNHAGYPSAYPNTEYPDPFALSIGTIISETCQGVVSNFSLALSDPSNPGTVNLGEEGTEDNSCYGRELSFIRDIARQTNAYSEVIQAANQKGNNLSNKYVDGNPLSQKLKTVARLISGGLQTCIYVVQLGGFDLHSNQAEAGDPSLGTQTVLLQRLSEAIEAFQEDCVQLDIQDRVLGMTYSEFGRRIRSNESLGTDHGTAAPIFVFGSCANPSVIGDNPQIDPQVGVSEGVPMQFDFRSVYASILMDWFGVAENDVREVLFDDFQHLPIVNCSTTNVEDFDSNDSEIDLKVKPSPFTHYFDLSFVAASEYYRISLFDVIGTELKIISARTFSTGEHELRVSSHELPAGIYFIRVASHSTQKTIRIVKS